MKLAIATSKKKSKYGPIADALQKSGVVDIVSLADQSNFHEYDHIIVFYNKVPEIVNRPKGKIAWWMNDLRKPTDLLPLKDYNFDDIFICHKTYDKEYKEFYKKPLHYMPQCGHAAPLEKGRKIEWDMVFLGNAKSNRYYHKDRAPFIEKVGKAVRLKNITGEGQTKDQHWIYNQSKYSLAMSFPMIEGTSNRLYNILSSGGFCITKYYPGLEKQFRHGKHLVWFHNAKECMELIEYYNTHEEERKKIAKAGHEQYLKKHTAAHRLHNMFDIMMGKETEFRGYINE